MPALPMWDSLSANAGQKDAVMRAFGYIIMIMGLLIASWPAFFVPDTQTFVVPAFTNADGQSVARQSITVHTTLWNDDDRRTMFLIGLGIAVAGSILFGVGFRSAKSRKPLPCPYCGERIRANAKVCRHCRRDIDIGCAPGQPR
jgi:hypothetical protein